MIYKCLVGNVPPLPEVNAHQVLLHGHIASNVPDYPIYVDIESGKKWMRSDMLQRISRLATALVADPKDGGLGLKPGRDEIVGIFTKGRVVSPQINGVAVIIMPEHSHFCWVGLQYLMPRFNDGHDTRSSPLFVLYSG